MTFKIRQTLHKTVALWKHENDSATFLNVIARLRQATQTKLKIKSSFKTVLCDENMLFQDQSCIVRKFCNTSKD